MLVGGRGTQGPPRREGVAPPHTHTPPMAPTVCACRNCLASPIAVHDVQVPALVVSAVEGAGDLGKGAKGVCKYLETTPCLLITGTPPPPFQGPPQWAFTRNGGIPPPSSPTNPKTWGVTPLREGICPQVTVGACNGGGVTLCRPQIGGVCPPQLPSPPHICSVWVSRL